MKSKIALSVVMASALLLFGGCSSGGSATKSSNDSTKNKTVDAQKSKLGFSGHTEAHGTLNTYVAPSLVAGNNKKLFAIYMVGSDLEGNGGAGTTDLNELVAGYNQLSETQKSSVDIIVGFGGSNKEGWKGLKIVNIEQIIEDSKDGVYGNTNSYQHYSPEAHMGDSSSLRLFVQYLKDGFVNHETKFLSMWDHGSAYGSFGNDDNFDGDGLTMEETDSAFSSVGLKFDVIGYDACLNGNFELASIISKHSKYMIGSEELEPGHGWNYSAVLPAYVKNSDITLFGKAMIDNFVSKNSHQYESDGKTLSMVDLSKYEDLKKSVDALALYLYTNISDESVKQAVISASAKSEHFGKQSQSDKTITIDLKKFVQQLNLQDSNASDLLSNLSNYIVYAKNDGSRPNANGVSIVPPQGYESFSENVAPSNSWLALTKSMQGIASSDTSAPVTESEVVDSETNEADFYDEDAQNSVLSFYETLQNEISILLDTQWKDLSEIEKQEAQLSYWYENEDNFWNDNNNQKFRYFETDSLTLNTSLRQINTSKNSFLGAFAGYTSTKKYSKRVDSNTTSQTMSGTRAVFTDPNLVKVNTIYGNKMNIDGVDYIASTALLQALETNKKGEYFTPTWNQSWYMMYFGDNQSDNTWLPMEFESEYHYKGEWLSTYSAEIDYVDIEKDYSKYSKDEQFDYAKLYITVDSKNNVLSNSVRPYKIVYASNDDQVGSILYDKASKSLKVGDQISLLARYYNLQNNTTEWFYESDLLTISKAPTFTLEELVFVDENDKELDYSFMMIASDIGGNWSTTKPTKPTKKGN